MAKLAASDLKNKRVAIIDDRTSYGQGIAKVFTQTAKKTGHRSPQQPVHQQQGERLHGHRYLKVASWIHANAYNGIAGEYAFDAQGNQKKGGITIYQFKGAAPVAIKSL